MLRLSLRAFLPGFPTFHCLRHASILWLASSVPASGLFLCLLVSRSLSCLNLRFSKEVRRWRRFVSSPTVREARFHFHRISGGCTCIPLLRAVLSSSLFCMSVF